MKWVSDAPVRTHNLQDRALLLFGKALGEGIHLRLKLFWVLDLSDLCLPSILGLAFG